MKSGGSRFHPLCFSPRAWDHFGFRPLRPRRFTVLFAQTLRSSNRHPVKRIQLRQRDGNHSLRIPSNKPFASLRLIDAERPSLLVELEDAAVWPRCLESRSEVVALLSSERKGYPIDAPTNRNSNRLALHDAGAAAGADRPAEPVPGQD